MIIVQLDCSNSMDDTCPLKQGRCHDRCLNNPQQQQSCYLRMTLTMRHYHYNMIMIVLFIWINQIRLIESATTTNGNINTTSYDATIRHHLDLFHYSEELHVLGPTRFPKPTEIFQSKRDYNAERTSVTNIVPYLRPVHGQHRPEKDALVAFAAEYPILNYLSFIESLRETGYKGDVILSISQLDIQKEDVWTYLTNADDPNDADGLRVILYAPKLTCYNAENEIVESFKGGARVCYGHGMFGIPDPKQNNHHQLIPLPDPREPRTVQTLRYELYWIMCQAYHPYSWIFVIDARDSVFQTNPFQHVPRRHHTNRKKNEEKGGLIYMFGENVEATRLGKSDANRKWLQAAYGNNVGIHWLGDKPTICSGATMGEWIALETYFRAMVAESDHTGVRLAGADQGFHNYIHYSHKLKHATATIAAIVVFDQGQGIVNNMGALRTKPLEQWGNGQIVHYNSTTGQYIVQNWDGTPSPVVHQFDRHQQLSEYYFKTRGRLYSKQWQQRLTSIQQQQKNKKVTTSQQQHHIRGATATQ
jgi:hypothetical protein